MRDLWQVAEINEATASIELVRSVYGGMRFLRIPFEQIRGSRPTHKDLPCSLVQVAWNAFVWKKEPTRKRDLEITLNIYAEFIRTGWLEENFEQWLKREIKAQGGLNEQETR